jgi:hypothetical protein
VSELPGIEPAICPRSLRADKRIGANNRTRWRSDPGELRNALTAWVKV